MRCDLSDHFQGSPAQRFRNLARLAVSFWALPKNLSKRNTTWSSLAEVIREWAPAISAARMGCKVALIQDRGFSEETVQRSSGMGQGKHPPREIPQNGEIIEEIADKAKKFPAPTRNSRTPKRKYRTGRKIESSTLSSCLQSGKQRK